MEIVPAENVSDEAWDAFCISSPEAWIRHTSMHRHFVCALDKKNEDHSFACEHQGAILAVAPLVSRLLSEHMSEREFSLGGTPILAPARAAGLRVDMQDKTLAVCMEEVDRRARKLGVVRTQMFIDPLTEPILSGNIRANPLPFFGYRNTSTSTSCIDLRKDEAELLKCMSKGHRADIVFARKQGHRVYVFDSTTIQQKTRQAFLNLYFAAAGKEVGTPERWSMSFEQIKKGYGFVAFIDTSEHEHLACARITMYKHRAYYGLSAIDPRFRSVRGIGHLLQWEIIRELKRRGVSHYELGSQHGTTEKERNIASFKRHFGGDLVPLFSGEKDYGASSNRGEQEGIKC